MALHPAEECKMYNLHENILTAAYCSDTLVTAANAPTGLDCQCQWLVQTCLPSEVQVTTSAPLLAYKYVHGPYVVAKSRLRLASCTYLVDTTQCLCLGIVAIPRWAGSAEAAWVRMWWPPHLLGSTRFDTHK